VRFAVDTNVLVYAANRDCAEHVPARSALEEWLAGSTPWAVTWGIVYEFLRVVTHPKVFRQPLGANEALSFLNPILTSEVVSVLVPTERHGTLLRETIGEFGAPAGNIFHDLHTAVLMREHGVTEIMTADVDFRKFGFLTVTDPVRISR
jgi:toxin-antitoxin system PIN domain toxin